MSANVPPRDLCARVGGTSLLQEVDMCRVMPPFNMNLSPMYLQHADSPQTSICVASPANSATRHAAPPIDGVGIVRCSRPPQLAAAAHYVLGSAVKQEQMALGSHDAAGCRSWQRRQQQPCWVSKLKHQQMVLEPVILGEFPILTRSVHGSIEMALTTTF